MVSFSSWIPLRSLRLSGLFFSVIAEGVGRQGEGGELALGECLCALCVLAVYFFTVIAEVAENAEVWAGGDELALGSSFALFAS